MISGEALLAFSLATFVLLILPGPAVMYIVTRSATQGRAAGMASVAGIHLGTVVHVAAAMVGLSAVLVSSATAFQIVKLAGATYLLWLGVQAFRSYRQAEQDESRHEIQARPLRKVFFDGFTVNVLNPKTAVFFLSIVPQFVDAAASDPTATIALLGAIFIGLGLVSDGLYALAGDRIGRRVSTSLRFRRRKDLVAGAAYTCLGVATALAGSSD